MPPSKRCTNAVSSTCLTVWRVAFWSKRRLVISGVVPFVSKVRLPGWSRCDFRNLSGRISRCLALAFLSLNKERQQVTFTSGMISFLEVFSEHFLRDILEVHPLTAYIHSFIQPVKGSLKAAFQVLEMQRLLKISSDPPAALHVQGAEDGTRLTWWRKQNVRSTSEAWEACGQLCRGGRVKTHS